MSEVIFLLITLRIIEGTCSLHPLVLDGHKSPKSKFEKERTVSVEFWAGAPALVTSSRALSRPFSFLWISFPHL